MNVNSIVINFSIYEGGLYSNVDVIKGGYDKAYYDDDAFYLLDSN